MFVILGAISANLSFWQIGNRHPCSTCIWVCGICLCPLSSFYVFHWSVVVVVVVGLSAKTIRHKKERITYNSRNNTEWFFVRSNNSFIRITCVQSITILPLNLFGILYGVRVWHGCFCCWRFSVLLLLLRSWSVTDAAPFHTYIFCPASFLKSIVLQRIATVSKTIRSK